MDFHIGIIRCGCLPSSREAMPGEMLLEEFLRPADLTQVEAARRMTMRFYHVALS
jgi:plasmid maintenance system antidote protein VapI